jgi:two-component system sensor histidine kinase BaeS
MRPSLRRRLAFTHAAVALVAVVAIATIVVVIGGHRFNQYASADQSQRTRTVVNAITSGYQPGTGWDQPTITTIDQLALTNDLRVWVYNVNNTLVFTAGHMATGMNGSAKGSGAGMMGNGGAGAGAGMMGNGGAGAGAGMMGNGQASAGLGVGAQVKRYALTVGGQAVGVAVLAQPGASELPLNSAFRRDLLVYLVVAGVVVAFVAVTIGVVATRRVTAPLEALTAAAGAMSRGERRQRVTVDAAGRRDEVGALAAAFNDMAQAIEQQEQWRRVMTADLAHELRTPLATIQARVEALQDGVLPPSSENLAIIADEVARLGRLLGALRSLDDMDAETFHLQHKPLRLDDVAGEAVAAARERFVAAQIDLDLQTQAATVAGDRDRLRQVIDNLVTNALKFTPAGGRVAVSVASTDSGFAELTVRDTGRGIAATDLPHVFERFYRGSGSQAYPGAGLGLAIAYRLVEAHGGSIAAQSDGGSAGAVFIVRLPLVAEGGN